MSEVRVCVCVRHALLWWHCGLNQGGYSFKDGARGGGGEINTPKSIIKNNQYIQSEQQWLRGIPKTCRSMV